MLFAGTAMELLGRLRHRQRTGTRIHGIGLAVFHHGPGQAADRGGCVRRHRPVSGGRGGLHEQVRPNPRRGDAAAHRPLPGLRQRGGRRARRASTGRTCSPRSSPGPVLVKNPRLLETVADAICARRGISLPEERPVLPLCGGGLRHHSGAVEAAGRGPAVIAGRSRTAACGRPSCFLQRPAGAVRIQLQPQTDAGKRDHGGHCPKTDRGAVQAAPRCHFIPYC